LLSDDGVRHFLAVRFAFSLWIAHCTGVSSHRAYVFPTIAVKDFEPFERQALPMATEVGICCYQGNREGGNLDITF
jgi:hypothetical protein